MDVLSAKNPKYTKDGGIELEVEFAEVGFLPFLASPNDIETHGRDLYNRAMVGEFGTVASCVESPEEIRAAAKANRAAAVEAIKVTTSTGKTFDGDEVAQTRMARAIIGMQAAGVGYITWVLADNTVTQATQAELTEAMVKAGQAQAAVWVIPE